jgi:hypothetical protein
VSASSTSEYVGLHSSSWSSPQPTDLRALAVLSLTTGRPAIHFALAVHLSLSSLTLVWNWNLRELLMRAEGD